MSFQSTTLGILTAYTGLTDLVPAASIWFETAPQNEQIPYIVCSVISSTPMMTTDCGATSAARLDNFRLQVDIYCDGDTASINAAEQVRKALEASRTTRYFQTNQFAGFTDTVDRFGQTLEFSCWYQSNS